MCVVQIVIEEELQLSEDICGRFYLKKMTEKIFEKF
jgi:hypothetical protein